jgi:hypothetical protein
VVLESTEDLGPLKRRLFYLAIIKVGDEPRLGQRFVLKTRRGAGQEHAGENNCKTKSKHDPEQQVFLWLSPT